jgi:ATP-dependent Clp protease ATP-binding subunit ClpA
VIDEAGAAQKILPKSKQKKVISKSEIEEIVAKIARIPAKNVTSDDRNALKTLDRDLKNVVFGQDRAIDALVAAIRMARSGLGNPQKPIGNFLFSGPHRRRQDRGRAASSPTVLGIELIRFDMSEYMERHAVSRLIGAPPGYIGFDQGGQLTEAITKHPYSVLLMDEIEKGAPRHLQHPAAGDGPRDAHRQQRAESGFPQRDDHHDDQRRRARAREGHARFHQREGVGRRDGGDQAAVHAGVPQPLDATISFAQLDHDVILRVVDKFLLDLENQLHEKKVEPTFTPKLKNFLAKKGFDPQMGRARWRGSSRTRSARRSPTSCCSAGWSTAATSRSTSTTKASSRSRSRRRRSPSRSRRLSRTQAIDADGAFRGAVRVLRSRIRASTPNTRLRGLGPCRCRLRFTRPARDPIAAV